jgi:hypothetical protein
MDFFSLSSQGLKYWLVMPWHDPTVNRLRIVGPRHGVAKLKWTLFILTKKIVIIS